MQVPTAAFRPSKNFPRAATGWSGATVRACLGRLHDVVPELPGFRRRPARGAGGASVARAGSRAESPAPATALPHASVLGALTGALRRLGIGPEEVESELRMGEYGARMVLQLRLPDRYGFDPGDRHPLAVRVTALNYSGAGGRLRVAVNWNRAISCSALPVGTPSLLCHSAQRQAARPEELSGLLGDALSVAGCDQAAFRRWQFARLAEADLIAWVDGPLRRVWGAGAAARCWHVFATGHDAVPASRAQQAPPHRRAMRGTARIPGLPAKAGTAWDVALGLAWVAGDRRPPEESLDWMAGIPGLMRSVTGAAA